MKRKTFTNYIKAEISYFCQSACNRSVLSSPARYTRFISNLHTLYYNFIIFYFFNYIQLNVVANIATLHRQIVDNPDSGV